eukprot:Pgem_evm1s3681
MKFVTIVIVLSSFLAAPTFSMPATSSSNVVNNRQLQDEANFINNNPVESEVGIEQENDNGAVEQEEELFVRPHRRRFHAVVLTGSGNLDSLDSDSHDSDAEGDAEQEDIGEDEGRRERMRHTQRYNAVIFRDAGENSPIPGRRQRANAFDFSEYEDAGENSPMPGADAFDFSEYENNNPLPARAPIVVHPDGQRELPTGKDCAVCFSENLSENKLHTTRCGHTFCVNCMTNVRNSETHVNRDRCPCCRRNLDEDEA